MKKNGLPLFAAAIFGAALALLGRVGTGELSWTGLSSPLRKLGEILRSLSLSGVLGNLAAWAVVLAICALPLLLLTWGRRQMGSKAPENLLLPLLSVLLFLLCFFLVNPTWLGEPASSFFPLAAVLTGLSILLAWFALRLLRGLDTVPAERLSAAMGPLLGGCALLLTFGAAFGQVTELIARWSSVLEGNSITGAPLMMGALSSPGTVNFTLFFLVVLAALNFIPSLLAALTLLWGAELVGALTDMTFDQEAVDLCGETARYSKAVAQATVILAVVTNLLQLALLGMLHSTNFSVSIPLFPLALSAALYLLCSWLRRGKELQDDSDSII